MLFFDVFTKAYRKPHTGIYTAFLRITVSLVATTGVARFRTFPLSGGSSSHKVSLVLLYSVVLSVDRKEGA